MVGESNYYKKGDVLMNQKKKDYNFYQEKFEQLINAGVPIIERKGKKVEEVFVPAADEVFKQCWADTVTRRTLPTYWFVSNYANLISGGEKKLKLVHKEPRKDSGKFSYKYVIRENGEAHVKNIEGHDLAWLVFGADSFGLAEELFQEKGIHAFGVRSKEGLNVQGHHKDGDDINNDPENGKFVTDRVHTLFDQIPSLDASDKEQIGFMKNLGKMMDQENPDKITILWTDDVYDPKTGKWTKDGKKDITAESSIVLTGDGMEGLMEIIRKFQKKDDEEQDN